MTEKKKGFLSSLLFEDVPEPIKATVVPVAPTTAGVTNTSIMATPPVSTISSGQVDQDIIKQLMKVVEDNNVEGYDYFEFRSAIENMKAVIPDEVSRFKAAFAAVSSIVSADKLKATAEFYLSKLDDHKTAFEGFSKKLSQEKVEGKEAKAKSMEQDIINLQTQITKINENIAKLQADKNTLLIESATEKVKIEAIRTNFMTSFDKFVGDIKADIQKITSYLPK